MHLPTGIFIPTFTPTPTIIPTPTVAPIPVPSITPLAVHVLSMPSLNWISKLIEILASGFATSIIVLAITLLVDFFKEDRYYKNLLALLVKDLQLRFALITQKGAKYPNEPMLLKTDTWETVKLEVSKKLPVNLVVKLQEVYGLLSENDGRTYNEFLKGRLVPSGKRVTDLIEPCVMWLLDLLKANKENKRLHAKEFEDYRLILKQSDNSSTETIN
jgi:hypothetical protein